MMSNPIEALREYADKLEKLEAEYGIEASIIIGQSVLHEKTRFDFENMEKEKVWQLADEEASFIGIMPNQWRPEVHIRVMIYEIPIRIFSYQSHGFNHYDGGFLEKYDKMVEEFKSNNAPGWVAKRLKKLYDKCVQNNRREELERKKRQKEEELKGINKELESYQ